jgi:hypothetical protein
MDDVTEFKPKIFSLIGGHWLSGSSPVELCKPPGAVLHAVVAGTGGEKPPATRLGFYLLNASFLGQKGRCRAASLSRSHRRPFLFMA